MKAAATPRRKADEPNAYEEVALVHERNPSILKGERVAAELRSLGVRGVLVTMAERGQVVALRCEMPTCYCPEGRTHFVKKEQPMPDWAPNFDHFPRLKADGGKREPSNARLAHTRCNQEDNGWRLKIRSMLRKGMSLHEIAGSLNQKGVRTRRNEAHWTAASVRWAYVS
jgi:hypothetical protein